MLVLSFEIKVLFRLALGIMAPQGVNSNFRGGKVLVSAWGAFDATGGSTRFSIG